MMDTQDSSMLAYADELSLKAALNGVAGSPPETALDSDSPSTPQSPLTLPVPATAAKLHELLRRFRELDASQTHEHEKAAILRVLREIDAQQQQYEQDLAEETQSWQANEESVDEDLLRTQVMAFQLLSKDLDLPLAVQMELRDEKLEEVRGKVEEVTSADLEIPREDYEKKASLLGITPSKPTPQKGVHAVGSDEAEMQVATKIQARINELEGLPANLGCYDAADTANDLSRTNDEVLPGVDELKVRALLELKALRALPFQKDLRTRLVNKSAADGIIDDATLNSYAVFRAWKRMYYIRPKQRVAQTARLAEKLQEQQKREQRERLRRMRQSRLQGLVEVINEAQNEVSGRKNLRFALGKAVHHVHQQSEREASRRKEKTAKQRLQALKANDEEAYIKLLDETKDQRITHLLKQTNSFLGSLASAVKVQQEESKIVERLEKGEVDGGAVEPVAAEDVVDESGKIDYYEVAHRIKEHVTVQPPSLVGGKLKEYQMRGLEWMVSLYNNHLNGILADEMGLGKTIQSLALITYLMDMKHETGKFLVIVPLSTITNWTLEFDRWAPSIKKIVYKGSQQQRKAMTYSIRSGDFTVMLTTYEYVIRDRPMLAKFKWAHMIIDEGHRLKNTHSRLFQTLTQYYRTRNRLILTGTPLQNSLPELWALLNFILPKVFNSVKSFDEWFNTPFANTGHQEKLALSEEESLLIIRRLHKVLRPFLLRRLKKDVEKDLPNKVEKVIKCRLSALQSRIYKQLVEHNALFIGSGSVGANKSGLRGLNNRVMQLRKICNHPFVFDEVEDIVNPSRLTTDTIWRSSGKFELLDRILPKLKRTGHRTLMFFQMTQVMDIMEDFLRLRGVQYLRLDGSTKADDRQEMLKGFNKPNSEYFCFLLSTRAGGLGLNLQTADTVVIFDTDWNPHQDLQAQDRAHRIGQKHEVRIYRLITEESVEEAILERAHKKLDIDGKVIQAGRFDNRSSAEEQEAFLKRMLESEKNKSQQRDTDEMDDEELNEILARNDEEKALFEQMDAERHAEEERTHVPRLMTDDELPDVFKVDVAKQLEPDHEEIHRRRSRKRVIYDDGLTEDQWLQALDDDNDTVEKAALRKRDSIKRRRARRAAKDGTSSAEPESSDFEGSADSSVPDGDDSEDYGATSDGEPAAKKRRRTNGRSRSHKPTHLVEEYDQFSEEEADQQQYAEPDEEPYVAQGLALLKQLKQLKDASGRKLCELFLSLPSKKLYPDYYQIIAEPIAFREIQTRLKKGRYQSYDEFLAALQTMFDNARKYNQADSVVCQDAAAMEAYVKDHKEE